MERERRGREEGEKRGRRGGREEEMKGVGGMHRGVGRGGKGRRGERRGEGGNRTSIHLLPQFQLHSILYLMNIWGPA